MVIFIVPVANADITINNVNFARVVTSTPPNYGYVSFNIMAEHALGQNETIQIPVVVNGTLMKTIDIEMSATESIKTVSAEILLPNAQILIINPFASYKPVANVSYKIDENPFMNPISSIDYDVKIGEFTKHTTLLVYSDRSALALIADIILVVATMYAVKKYMS